MGLKKENYEVKDLGITLPVAYAVVRKLDRQGKSGYAELWIHNSRHNALTKNALERHSVTFTIKDGENPTAAAYKEATTRHTHKEFYFDTEIVDGLETKVRKMVEVEYPAILDGWEDDIKVADDEKNS